MSDCPMSEMHAELMNEAHGRRDVGTGAEEPFSVLSSELRVPDDVTQGA